MNEHSPLMEPELASALRTLTKRGQATDLGRGWHGRGRMWAIPERAATCHGRAEQTFGIYS